MREVFGGVRLVTFAVDDLARSRDFYVGRLGFALMAEDPGRHALVNAGTFRLRLEPPSPGVRPGGPGTVLTFRVKHLGRTAQELQERGVAHECFGNAATGDYLEVRDPDGYRLRFTERL